MADINEPLSEREIEILRLVATGAANKEIARQLSISPNTVKVHLRNIFTKTGVASRTEATLYAVRMGLVPSAAVQAPADEPGEPTETGTEDAYLVGAALPVLESGSGDSYSPGLPTITIEGEGPGGDRRTGAEPTTKRRGIRAWQVGLALLAAVLLISAGVIGSRYLSPSTPATPSTTQVVLPAQITEAAVVSSRWKMNLPLPASRKGMGMVEYENKFYMIAGETSQGVDGSLMQYDPEKNTWQTLAQKPTPVTDVQAALLGEKIYVPGGLLKDGSATNRLEVYDPRQNAWESKADLPTALSGYALASYEGNLYLFGGKTGSQYSKDVYSYDPGEDRWYPHSALSSPRAFAGAAALSGRIYLLGGYDGKQALKRVEVYFPNRDSNGTKDTVWESQPDMPQARYGMAVIQLANLVYLLGGLDSAQALASPAGLQYQPQSNDWMPIDTPPAAIGSFGALVSLGNNLYLFGGETPDGLLTNSLSYQAIYTINVPSLQK